MAKQNEDARVTPQQLQWLLERMNAGIDPITRQQIEMFGRHSGGPILPPECLASKRLPDNFGTRREGRPPLEFDRPVADIAVSPTGEVWVATVINGTSWLAKVNVLTVPLEGRHDDLALLYLLPDVEDGTLFSPHIIGFNPDGTPVTLLEKNSLPPRSMVFFDDETFIFLGGRRVLSDQLPRKLLMAICLASDGAVLTAHMLDVGGHWEIYRDGKLAAPHLSTAVDSGLWQYGNIILWTGRRGELYVYEFCASHLGPEQIDKVRVVTNHHNVRDVFMRNGRVHYISRSAGGISTELYSIENRDVPVWEERAEHTYRRGFTDLPDGRIAYIGDTIRDRYECWVVDGVAGPGFDRVTGLVFRNGRALYYGALGRHLFTMEIPNATTKK